MRNPSSLIAVLGATALALSACSAESESGSTTSGSSTQASADVVAVTTTTPLGSVVSQIAACGGGTATTIMGPGDDPHSFEASSKQVAEMVAAPLVVISGLGLEEGILNALESAAEDGANILDVGSQIDPLTFGGEHYDTSTATEHHHDEDEEEEGHTHAAEDPDPHWWLDVERMAQAATIIGDALAQSTGDSAYETCGQQMQDELTELNTEVDSILSVVPEANRKLVTDHKAFQYFSDRYGFTMVGTVVPSGSTEAEPSSEEMAQLVATIEAEQIPAIFTNTAVSSTLPDAIAAEVGFDVSVVALYVGSVGDTGSGASTYQEMMLTDAHLIADALQ